MPLSLEYETPSTGVVATYHVAAQAVIDWRASNCTVTVESYLSKDVKDAGKWAVYTQMIVLDGLPVAGQDARDYAEAQLIVAIPDSVPVPPLNNRYTFTGAVVVD